MEPRTEVNTFCVDCLVLVTRFKVRCVSLISRPGFKYKLSHFGERFNKRITKIGLGVNPVLSPLDKTKRKWDEEVQMKKYVPLFGTVYTTITKKGNIHLLY